MIKEKPKVLLGMSGGVDSTVSAVILKNLGYSVQGLFILINEDERLVQKDICELEKTCEKIGIDFSVVDARQRFKKEVVGYFLDEYAVGRTPNPCVFCNENFKFKILFEEADKLKMEYVATGHYARVVREITNSKDKINYKLFSAKDENKDQSYFLYRLGQKELARIIFPLGEYEKTAVRKLAKENGLAVSEKKDSQDVCFMKGITTADFLRKNLKLKKGSMTNVEGKIIGEHEGLSLYTLGQRKGINLGGDGPYYVVSKDIKKNKLIVTNNKEETNLFSKEAILEKIAWANEKPELPFRVLVRSRYRNPLVYATIQKQDLEKNEYEIEFEKPEKAVTSGQSVVFYGKDGEIFGGGIIV